MLCQHGLLLHDSARGQHYYVHTAVREAGKAALDRETAASLQERYIAYVLQLLGGWAQLYATKSASLALSEARAHTADLRSVGAEKLVVLDCVWLLSNLLAVFAFIVVAAGSGGGCGVGQAQR